MTQSEHIPKNFGPHFGGMLWMYPLMEKVIYKSNEIPFISLLTADEIKVMLFFLVMGKGVSTSIEFTQGEISNRLGMTRESVCRAIKSLENKPQMCRRKRNNLKLEPILLKHPEARSKNKYRINPEWGFKGSRKDYHRAMKQKNITVKPL